MDHPHAGHPAMMLERFGRFSQNDTELFVVRKLDMRGMKVESPAPPIRSDINCFFHVTSGEAVITIGEETYFFRSDQCATIPAGQLFAVKFFDNCTGYMGGFHTDFLNCNTDGRNVVNAFGFLRHWGSHKVRFDPHHAKYIVDIFERLHLESGGERNLNIIKVYLTTLLTEIEEATKRPENSGTVLTDNTLCNNFIEMVFDRCDHSLPLDRYVSELNISKNYLHKTVKRFTGKTPLMWIIEAVVLEAKVLLSHTGMSVGEISCRVGIEDPSYFSRLFKKQTGKTPVEYREASK